MVDGSQVVKLSALLLLLVVISTLLVLTGDFAVAIIALVILLGLVLAFRYPRWGLWLFLVYLPFGGTVSYSIARVYKAVGGGVSYSGAYSLFHLAKDAFYLPALLAIVLSTGIVRLFWRKFQPFCWALLGLSLSALLTLVLVNGNQTLTTQSFSPLLMGLIGLKLLLGYVPLTLCAYYLMGDRQDLRRLMRLHVVLVLICCSLCLIQYLLLSNGICSGSERLPEPANLKASLQARCFVGGSLLYNPERHLIRLPGTFVSPWQWGWFLIANSFFLFGAKQLETHRLWQIGNYLALFLILGISLLSGQRVALLAVPVILVSLFLLSESRKLWRWGELAAIIGLGIILWNQWSLLQQRLDNLIGRWNYKPPYQFIQEQFQEVIANNSSWLGQGLGRATSAARQLGDIRLIETHYARLLYEIGWLGMVLFVVLVTALTWLTWRSLRQVKEAKVRKFGFCLWLFVLFISYNTYYYPLAVDPVAVYYWFFAGVLLRLPELEGFEGSAAQTTAIPVDYGNSDPTANKSADLDFTRGMGHGFIPSSNPALATE